MIRTALTIAAMLLLSGCNMVISDDPWFSASDGAPRLAAGLWAFEKPDCNFDPAAVLEKWPECASPLFVRGHSFLTPPNSSDPAKPVQHGERPPLDQWDVTVPVLADGNPAILQLKLESGKSGSDGIAPQKLPYIYMALQPTARDADGTLRGLRMWPVFCGPPRMETVAGKASRSADPTGDTYTPSPFPGLMRADVGCHAQSQDALRAAAARSEAVAAANGAPPLTAIWVRDRIEP